MKEESNSLEEYIGKLPEERKQAIEKLRSVILENLPEGFEEGINYGMPGYYVPHSVYPNGYHTDPKQPLPFINIASQKYGIGLYHMGLYADKELLKWFSAEYEKNVKSKMDMGKSCIRFKKMEEIPYKLIGELVSKISAKEWIEIYESILNRKS